MTRIFVISDTHARSLQDLPKSLIDNLVQADYVVHCGDYTHLSILQELRQVAKRFIGVHGNVDPREIRDQLPAKTVFESEGKRIGVIHPHWGGPPWGIENDIAREFDDVDIILFGHTHDKCQNTINNIVFLNPGQAYPSFRYAATAGMLLLDRDRVEIEIKSFE